MTDTIKHENGDLKMNKGSKNGLLAAIGCLVTLYLVGAFCEASFNIVNWDSGLRAFVSFFAVPIAFIAFFIAYDITEGQ